MGFAAVRYVRGWLVGIIAIYMYVQGHPERMSKVNPFARAFIFTKSGFSEVFWDEK